MKKLILFGMAMLFASAAQAADLNVVSGTYVKGDGYYGEMPKDSFTILKLGTKVQVIDNLHGIRYVGDINSTVEQEMNSRYISYLRSRRDARALGLIIKRITIGDFTQVSADTISANLYVEIGTNSVFGSADGVVVVGASVKVAPGTVRSYTNGGEKRTKSSCLQVIYGSSLSLAKFSSSLGQSTDRTIGLSVDFLLKILQPLAYSESELCYVP